MGKSYSHVNRIKNTGARNRRRYTVLIKQVTKDVVVGVTVGMMTEVMNKALGGKG